MYDLPVDTIVTVKKPISDWYGHTLTPGTRAIVLGMYAPVYVPPFGTDELYRVRYLDVEHDAFVCMAVDPVNVEVLTSDE